MGGRHRKPPKYQRLTYYSWVTAFWLLLGALVFLMILLLRDVL